jgi:hypothetical protein
VQRGTATFKPTTKDFRQIAILTGVLLLLDAIGWSAETPAETMARVAAEIRGLQAALPLIFP